MWYSWRARLLSAIVESPLPDFSLCLAIKFPTSTRLGYSPIAPAAPTIERDYTIAHGRHVIHQIRRQAIVSRSDAQMYALVNDIEAYPRRFSWCSDARILERQDAALLARLE